MEFVEPAEARAAFRRLAYSRFKHVPLYLEWAPDDTFLTADEQKLRKIDEIDNTRVSADGEQDDIEPEPETTLFIKNLNFETNEDSIRQVREIVLMFRSPF